MPTQRLNLFYGGQPGMSASGFDVMSENARGIMRAAQDKARFLADEEDLQYRRGVAEAERARHMQLEDEDRLGLPLVEASKLSDVDPNLAPARFRPVIAAHSAARRKGDWDKLSLEGEKALSDPAGGLDLPGGGGDLPEGLVGKTGRSGGALSLGGAKGAVSRPKADRVYLNDLRKMEVTRRIGSDLMSAEELSRVSTERAKLEKMVADEDAADAEAAKGRAPVTAERTYNEGQRARARMLVTKIKAMPQEERQARGWSDDRVWDLYKIGWPQEQAAPAAPANAPLPAPPAMVADGPSPAAKPIPRPMPEPIAPSPRNLDLPVVNYLPTPPSREIVSSPSQHGILSPDSEYVQGSENFGPDDGDMTTMRKFPSSGSANAAAIHTGVDRSAALHFNNKLKEKSQAIVENLSAIPEVSADAIATSRRLADRAKALSERAALSNINGDDDAFLQLSQQARQAYLDLLEHYQGHGAMTSRPKLSL